MVKWSILNDACLNFYFTQHKIWTVLYESQADDKWYACKLTSLTETGKVIFVMCVGKFVNDLVCFGIGRKHEMQ